MQIRLLTDRVGGYGTMQRDGDVIDVPEREAFRMIQRGQASEIEPRFAVAEDSENTTQPHSRNKRKQVNHASRPSQ